MIKKVFTVEMRAPFIAGLFLCGILAAIMSTADSQLLVSASSVAEDIFKGLLKKDADDKTVMNVSRVTVLVVAVLAYIIAWNPNNTVMGLVSNAWAGLGAAFGPLVVMSLYWKRTNFPSGSRNCHRCTCRYHLGLHPSRGRTDSGQSYRIVFPGSRLRAGTYLLSSQSASLPRLLPRKCCRSSRM